MAVTQVRGQQIKDELTDTDIAAANKDGAAATPCMRTLGTGSSQAAAGNDSRLSDARTPTAHKTTHQPGGSDQLVGLPSYLHAAFGGL